MKNAGGGGRTREKLSRETIAATAVALADAEGLDAVTIRRLAHDHNVTPMALYWHFKDKAQLLEGIAERLFATVDLPPVSLEPWPEQLRTVLEAVAAALRPHPDSAALAGPHILSSEAGLAVAERALFHLRQAGFSAQRAAEIGGYLLNAVVTLVTSEPGRRHHDGEANEAAVRMRAAHLGALPPRRYPNIVAASDSLAACASPDDYYRLGLDLLIAGVRGVAD